MDDPRYEDDPMEENELGDDQVISNGKVYSREEHEEWLNKKPTEGKIRQCSSRINAAKRRAHVMDLRLQGKSFRQIAELLDSSVTTVCRDYKVTMQENLFLSIKIAPKLIVLFIIWTK